MRTVFMRRELCCLLLGSMVVLCECTSGPTQKTALIKSTKQVESSAAELSSRNRSLLGLYCAEIEAAADKIILESPSSTTRRQALEWKAEAIPVLQTSLLNTDPLAAALDTWSFLMQMKAYMEQPPIKQGWGQSYPVVEETLNRMNAEMEELLRAAAPSVNIGDVRQKISSWAKAHPVEAGLPGRKSLDADLIRRTEQTDLGTRASIKLLGESIGDLTARMDSYNAYLPKQARWQAELLLTDLASSPQVDAAVTNVAALSSRLEKTSGTVEQMPELMGQLQKTTMEDMNTQRLDAQAFLHEERLQTLDALRQERIAVLSALDRERLAATTDLRGERQIVLDALHNEEDAVMNDLNSAAEKWQLSFNTSARGLIDHFFVRAFELLLLGLALCAVVAWILLRWFINRRREFGERLYDRAA